MNYRKLFQVALVSAAIVGLGACDTMNQGMSDTGDWFSNHNPFHSSGNEDKAQAPATTAATQQAPASCLPVTVVDDLKMLNQFTDEQAPRAENNVSSVLISNVSSRCTPGDKNITVDLDLTFDGVLGPKSRTWNTDKPSFAYPYFVALTLPDGKIVTKEVYGVTLSYAKDQNNATQHEHLHQVIPAQDGQAEQLVVGFQLSESQLAYNRSLEGKQNEAAGIVPADSAAAPAKAPVKKPVVKKKHKKKPVAPKPAAAPAPATAAPTPAAEAPAATPAPAADAAPAPAATSAPTTTTAPEVQATPPAQPAPDATTAPAPSPSLAPDTTPAPATTAPTPTTAAPAPSTTDNAAPAAAPAPATTAPAPDAATQPPAATTPPTGAQ